jgi:hypothetical protein
MYCTITTYSTSRSHLTYGSLECNKYVCMYSTSRLNELESNQSDKNSYDKSVMQFQESLPFISTSLEKLYKVRLATTDCTVIL